MGRRPGADKATCSHPIVFTPNLVPPDQCWSLTSLTSCSAILSSLAHCSHGLKHCTVLIPPAVPTTITALQRPTTVECWAVAEWVRWAAVGRPGYLAVCRRPHRPAHPGIPWANIMTDFTYCRIGGDSVGICDRGQWWPDLSSSGQTRPGQCVATLQHPAPPSPADTRSVSFPGKKQIMILTRAH